MEEDTFSVRVQWTINLPAVNERARLWIPYATSNTSQLVTQCLVSLPKHDHNNFFAFYTDQKFNTPVLHIEMEGSTEPREISFGFSVKRSRVARPSQAQLEKADCFALDTESNKLWLEETSKMSMNVVKLRCELVMRDANHPSSTIARLRAIYDWVCGFMSRDPNCKGCGDGDVCVLLDRKMGKCTDIHSVVVALARGCGVACREVFGLRLGNKAFATSDARSLDVSGWQHCWVEALIPGMGWVSLDPSDVLKDVLSLKIDKASGSFVELKDKYWLQLDPFRVALAVGRDVDIGPRIQNTFQYPIIQLDDKIFDQVASCDFFKIQVTKE